MSRYELLKFTRRLVNVLNGDEGGSLARRVLDARRVADVVHRALGRETVRDSPDMRGDLRRIHNLMTDAQHRAGETAFHSVEERDRTRRARKSLQV